MVVSPLSAETDPVTGLYETSMLSRLYAPAVLAFWLVAMTWLVREDIVPMWTAQPAPRMAPGEWLTEAASQTQARVENRYGHRIGTVWSRLTRSGTGLSRQDTAYVKHSSLLPYLPSLRVEMESDFTSNGVLDELRVEIFGTGSQILLEGERYSNQIGCKVKVGTSPAQLFKIDAAATTMVSDALRPFPTLPELKVGDTWRLQIVNPVAVASGVGPRLTHMLVRVTGRETIDMGQGPVQCFVVESDRAKAWVDTRGIVLRQEVELPFIGRLSVIAEPFDKNALQRARNQVPDEL